jgi:hypothetical protein
VCEREREREGEAFFFPSKDKAVWACVKSEEKELDTKTEKIVK